MKTLLKTRAELQKANRWDIDFHLPPEGIKKFPAGLLKRVDDVADITKDKRDPTRNPESAFQYVDISSIDVAVGVIANPQELEGSEAPSRARKVVRAFDLVISTCRPTRGAIAVVPPSLHDQIASTGFSVVRAHDDVNPFYLHYVLRLPSTLEQFRKWSTGSSYPAILDGDVAKTLIPVASADEQDRISKVLMKAFIERRRAIQVADVAWQHTLNEIFADLSGAEGQVTVAQEAEPEMPHTIAAIQDMIRTLPTLTVDSNGNNEAQITLEDFGL
jgi:type I restriction enzyme S subunit